MTTEEKFHAAVNVIRSLPKHGSYQPSHDLMLRFYAYFKQATEGPNPAPKPAFWEVVKKAKWDAWTKLGNMPKEEAMTNYVDELKKIVETMAYTDNVANFVSSLDSFYESVPAEDLELLIGPVLEKVRSQPGSPLTGSPLGSREASPLRNERLQEPRRESPQSRDKTPNSSQSTSPFPPESEDEDEDEAFMDTVDINIENVNQNSKRRRSESKRGNHVESIPRSEPALSCHSLYSENSSAPSSVRKGAVNSRNASQNHSGTHIGSNDTSEYQIIRNTVISLQRDLNILQSKVSHLESSVSLLKGRNPRGKEWSTNISKPSLTFVILWPIIVHFLFLWFRNKYLQKRP